MIYSVIIVGGGFSGLTLMNELLKDDVCFLLLEKNDRLGKKILATGNGRGNVSNVDLSADSYHGDDRSFCEYALKTYDNGHIRRFFEEKGVLLTSENGRIYPLSLQANAVLDALRLQADEKRVKTSCEVTDITFDQKQKLFKVYTEKGEYLSKKVVLCVGGKAAPHFGTDGKSYRLAEKFGHTITDLYPSLVQLTAEKQDIQGLKGVKENAKVTACLGKRVLSCLEGDILFTDNGVSGNTVFYLSSYITDKQGVSLYVDFLPGIEKAVCVDSLIKRRSAFPDLPIESFLSGLVHSRISYKTISDVFKEKTNSLKYKDVSDADIVRLVEKLKNTVIRITGNTGFSNCQVTKGGIFTNQVDNVTMESKLVKGLYFCGEVLDVDGNCGGYNLQWAFSSAQCVYNAIKGEK